MDFASDCFLFDRSYDEQSHSFTRTPTKIDCEWLLTTIEDLCFSANQIDRFHEIFNELQIRGFIYEDNDRSPVSKECIPRRVGSPFSQVYNNLEIIGKGGYGKVFKIVNLIDKQIYALKKVNILENEISNAVREVQCLAHLNSPRIVRYHNSWIEKNEKNGKFSLFIQMEYVHGILLSDYFTKRKEIDYDFNLKTIYELALSLKEIHQAGIVHRDFRPQNILIRENDDICVLDFGISSLKSMDYQNNTLKKEPPLTKRTMRVESLKPVRSIDRLAINAASTKLSTVREVGTPYYSSPEQLNGHKSNTSDDIYSLGIMIYEMFNIFGTTMVKAKEIQKLRTQRTMIDEFVLKYPKISELVLSMTNLNKKLRPSASKILEMDIFKKFRDKNIFLT